MSSSKAPKINERTSSKRAFAQMSLEELDSEATELDKVIKQSVKSLKPSGSFNHE